MRKDSLFHRFLIKIGFIKERSNIDDIRFKKEMCRKALDSGICPKQCENCAWDIDGEGACL